MVAIAKYWDVGSATWKRIKSTRWWDDGNSKWSKKNAGMSVLLLGRGLSQLDGGMMVIASGVRKMR